MRHEDLLREIRDSIRANTAATIELQTYLMLINNPVYTYHPGALTERLDEKVPWHEILVPEPNGVNNYDPVEERRTMRAMSMYPERTATEADILAGNYTGARKVYSDPAQMEMFPEMTQQRSTGDVDGPTQAGA